MKKIPRRELLKELGSRFKILENVIFAQGLGLSKIPDILLDIKGYKILLGDNKITSLEGLKQNSGIDLGNNKIKSLEGFS